MAPTPFYGARAEKNPKSRFCHKQTNICRLSGDITIMVQLPATAAIEYVAACWVSGAGGDFCPGGLLPGGTFGLGDFRPGGFLSGGLLSGGLMPVPPSSMRIRTV